MLRQDMSPVEEAKKAETKAVNLDGLKDALRAGIKQANQLVADTSSSMGLTHDDMSEMERALELSPKSMSTKASRFAHSEKLQFTKESDQGVAVVTSSTEEVILLKLHLHEGKFLMFVVVVVVFFKKKEEEIKHLKEDLEQLNQTYEDLEQELKKLNDSILEVCLKMSLFSVFNGPFDCYSLSYYRSNKIVKIRRRRTER